MNVSKLTTTEASLLFEKKNNKIAKKTKEFSLLVEVNAILPEGVLQEITDFVLLKVQEGGYLLSKSRKPGAPIVSITLSAGKSIANIQRKNGVKELGLVKEHIREKINGYNFFADTEIKNHLDGVIKPRIVQTMNPRTLRYIKIDREQGKIICTKRTKGPYLNIPILTK